jgi:hypothetical protein
LFDRLREIVKLALATPQDLQQRLPDPRWHWLRPGDEPT